jgi:hypothetical protein
VVARHLGELASEGPLARADDPPAGGDAVRLGDGARVLERGAERLDLAVEVGVERQLLRHDQRRDEHDPRAPVCGKPAGEVERVLRLRATEQRHDDAPVADGHRAACEPASAAVKRSEVRPAHHSSW